jgi:serine protease Do
MKMFSKVGWGLAVVAVLAAAVLLASSSKRTFASAPKVTVQDTPLARDTRLAARFSPVVKRAAPSVVNIYSTKTVRERAVRLPFFDDPFFRHFFGDDFDTARPPGKRLEQSLGSGVIVSPDGYILSNNHVVEGADEIRVSLANGNKTEHTAKVVGTDPQTDIAVLKIDAKDLPAITLADSDRLEVGDVVLAIGNPFGVGQTVTMGIVSAVGRSGFGVLGPGGYEDFIQTDASINPGNSGGALVDAEGRLVGINTFIISRSGGSAGVGFAVPVNLARFAMDRLVKDGKVTRGYLGAFLQPEITADLAREFKLPNQEGAMIAEVIAKSPAETAGLKDGDVVIEFNGRKVTDSRHLRLMVAQTPPDAKVSLKLIRNGKEQTLTVKLGELTEDKAPRLGLREGRRESTKEALDGVTVDEVDARARRQFDIPAHVRGAIVTEVEPGSPAHRAGLRPGDVIVEINRQPVRDAADAVELSKRTTDARVLLRVWSHGAMRFLVVDGSHGRK